MSTDIQYFENGEAFGVKNNFRQMPNGEVRLGLLADDGSSYTRTVSQVATWQNSHYHEKYDELYVVQEGQVALAILDDHEQLQLKLYAETDVFIVPHHTIHNIFQFAGAVTHNIKYGASEPNDWLASPTLDQLVKGLSAADILHLTK